MRVAACAAILLLMLTGCTQSTGGVAMREGASNSHPSSYRERVDKDTLTKRDWGAQLRAVDPCSLVNLDAAATLGQMNYVGARFEPDTCRITYEVPKHDVGVMEELPGFVWDVVVGARDVDYDNQGERTQPGQGECQILVPSGYLQDLITYRIQITGQTRDGCSELRSVVDASRDLIRSPKQRADSTHMPQSKIARLDPCQFLDVWAEGKSFRIVRPQSEYVCDAKLKGDGSDEDETVVAYQVHELDSTPHPATRGEEYTHLRGVLTHFEDRLRRDGPSRGKAMCTIESYVGLDNPITGRDAMSMLPQWVDVVAASGQETEIGCPKLLRAVEEAVRVYQEAS
ncbi:hypothetical protein BKG76_00245 [Mycobacteroides franklinii]|uniref:DUF3558 domain-containing protein n=1 Tax=Mycobacteroides franklinii TaxID=948102 RepID=A0A1S1LFH4_9MYCO|nr:hypothetical protein [Mycobacteroides franklinii]OHU31683.1 hypothetical protein BKG76_00245 [Mycobacteroides franklinii]